MKLLAIFTNQEEYHFLQTLAEAFSDLYEIQCLNIKDYKPDECNCQAIVTWQEIDSSLPQLNLSQLGIFDNINTPNTQKINLEFAHALVKFHREVETSILDSFSYQASLTSLDGQIIASNHKPTDPFDWDGNQAITLPKWILNQLREEPDKPFHITVPSPAFDQILIHTYQLCRDSKQEISGVFQYVQDIKPLLATYLEESGQALVGWSDVTSGASIQNDTFDF